MAIALRPPVDAGVKRRRADWYWDHDKRLEDALVAQHGIRDDGIHADGVHLWDEHKWRGK